MGNSSVYGMPAIGAHRQERKQRYLNDTGPDHGVGRPKRQTAQTQKLKEALIKVGKNQANRRRQWKRPIKDHIGG